MVAKRANTEAYNTSIYALNDREHQPWQDGTNRICKLREPWASVTTSLHTLRRSRLAGNSANGHKYDHSYSDDYAVPTIGGVRKQC